MNSKPPPPTIPGWEVLEFVGAGGMGEVWKARRADGAVAAVKVANPHPLQSSAEAAAFFRREALACLHADHPNLVRAFDAGNAADGRAYLATEFVEGRTLAAVIAADGAFPEARTVEVGLSLARALAHVHRIGLVHRDVTPRNVMLTRDGGVKLLDFGLVVESGEERGEHVFGTRGFVAPELLAGGAAGPASDVFALGATLAAAVTGNAKSRKRSLANADLPRSVPSGPVSEEFRAVIRRMLRADPAARYGSAAEVVLDLEAVSAGDRPLGAILGSAGAGAVRRGRSVAVAAALAAAAAAAAWWLTRDTHPAPADAHAGAQAAATPQPAHRDAKLDAAAVFLAKFTDDFAHGRELLDGVDASSLTAAEREELGRLRGECDRRFAAAVEREYADRRARVAALTDAGDVAQARQVATGWPEALRDSDRRPQLQREVEEATARLQAASEQLAADAERIARADGAAPADAGPAALRESVASVSRRVDAALARPEFEGDARARLLVVRPALDCLLAKLDADATVADAMGRWRDAVARHVAAPSPDALRTALRLAAADAMPETSRRGAELLGAAWERGERRLELRMAQLAGSAWFGPRGAELRCEVLREAPAVDDVYLSPLWSVSGGRARSVTAAASGADEAAAWLFSRGLWDDAGSSAGDANLLAAWMPAPPRPAAAAGAEPRWPSGFDLALALRAPGTSAAPSRSSDRVAEVWAAAADPKRRPAAATKNPDKVAGKEAFLAGDLPRAVLLLTAAAVADPADAEVAALRGRAYLLAMGRVPTAPAYLAAFSEARRAWDLDPRLPAGPVLAAEAGMAFVDGDDGPVAARMRPIVAAACEAADALGRSDARMLLFAGGNLLDRGRAQDALPLVTRAVAKSPESGAAALLLARAEHASGHADRARDALRRARDLFGGKLPESATQLARSLGM